MADLFVLVQTGKCATHGSSGVSEGVRPFPMRHAAAPIQIGAPTIPERGHYRAQFGMNAAAVVALVVILTDDFPIRRNLIANRGTYAQLRQGVALQPLRYA